jgi:hypothetical protein
VRLGTNVWSALGVRQKGGAELLAHRVNGVVRMDRLLAAASWSTSSGLRLLAREATLGRTAFGTLPLNETVLSVELGAFECIDHFQEYCPRRAD